MKKIKDFITSPLGVVVVAVAVAFGVVALVSRSQKVAAVVQGTTGS